MEKVTAPFTTAQVTALNNYQNNGQYHPFTCGKCGAHLVAQPEGWRCETNCGYTQNWAHSFMTEAPFADPR